MELSESNKLIQEVQTEVSEAKKAVKDESPDIAEACLHAIYNLLDKEFR